VPICDAHCHFLSAGLFQALGAETGTLVDAAVALPARLEWEPPGEAEALAARWVGELDRHHVERAMLIASVPGDELSVATAVRSHPSRFVGAFMFNPAAPEAAARLERALDAGMSTVCLFPALHRYSLDEPFVDAVFRLVAARERVVFVHCGLLSIGVRKKLGLPCPFDIRRGDPLAVAALAVRHPATTVIVPHFGSGLLRETLMASTQAPNIVLDSSSSNSWMKVHHGLTLRDTFARALDVVGPGRILFGTDSSFFPRGWHAAIHDAQREALTSLGCAEGVQSAIFGGNFQRIFSTDNR
jgi:predicted TIM-barrel fold metal-dependent hydrolase